MEQIKPNYFGGANFEARTVKDIIEPAKSISNKVSVRAALDQMQAQATDSSPVIDQRGELLGILSKNKMNRNVGGFGHDPKTEPVEAHIEKNNAYCFEDQTIAEAEQMMLNAKLGEVFVVTREKLLVGTINIEAIAQEGKKLGSRLNSESLRELSHLNTRFSFSPLPSRLCLLCLFSQKLHSTCPFAHLCRSCPHGSIHSLLPSQLYFDHSHRPVLAPATLAALPSTRAISMILPTDGPGGRISQRAGETVGMGFYFGAVNTSLIECA